MPLLFKFKPDLLLYNVLDIVLSSIFFGFLNHLFDFVMILLYNKYLIYPFYQGKGEAKLFLKQNIDRIDWKWLSSNPNIFEIDTKQLKLDIT